MGGRGYILARSTVGQFPRAHSQEPRVGSNDPVDRLCGEFEVRYLYDMVAYDTEAYDTVAYD